MSDSVPLRQLYGVAGAVFTGHIGLMTVDVYVLATFSPSAFSFSCTDVVSFVSMLTIVLVGQILFHFFLCMRLTALLVCPEALRCRPWVIFFHLLSGTAGGFIVLNARLCTNEELALVVYLLIFTGTALALCSEMMECLVTVPSSQQSSQPPDVEQPVALPPVSDSRSNSSPCPVCLESLEDGASSYLRCSHRFHQHCIARWLRQQMSCPVCRAKV